jgi:hypothetical protein
VSPNALQSVKSKKISFCILFNNSKKKNVSKIYLSIKQKCLTPLNIALQIRH